MARQVAEHRRVKVSVTLDPELLSVVDAFVAEYPESDRSKVMDEALMLWVAEQQARAMEEQFTTPRSETEIEEWTAWREIQDAAAIDLLSRWPRES